MNVRDPHFDIWLDEHEAAAKKVMQMRDHRRTHAADMVAYIPKVRVLVNRLRGRDSSIDPSEINRLVKTIEELRRAIKLKQ